MAFVSHRLKGALEGALAGGGDPATSPLYVFGPFLRLLVASGVGAICFGASIWLVVATVAVVGLMYRHVMEWIPDGSGGSGLCEEEFGGWAVKVNASITAIEYTLTFLVSIAALVTFVADRIDGLGEWPRGLIAIGLTVAIGAVVNRGPRLAARVFGPATAAVLLMLWVLVGAVILQRGLHLPSFDPAAFSRENLHVTLGGYSRLLALMTGIEVFANLVAAYDGPPAARARKAFGSMAIVMLTTLVTMVVVGPAIYETADPMRTDVSVFTQTMDRLLPAPVAYAGTLVGIVVLLSAAAASAQGIQNLALGLRHRQYVPASFGQRNRFDVADRPVVLQVALVAACFVAFGTHEETFLALYAAGVFVLLALTGWASVKRLVREARLGSAGVGSVVGTGLAASVTTGAAALILVERFLEGAWLYAVLVPALCLVFTRFRTKLGAPTPLEERLGRVLAEQKSFVSVPELRWPEGVLAVVDGTQAGEVALIASARLADTFAVPWDACVMSAEPVGSYAAVIDRAFHSRDEVVSGRSAQDVLRLARSRNDDLIVIAREHSMVRDLARTSDRPLLVVDRSAPPSLRYPSPASALVGLDGSADAESVLPFVARILEAGAKVELLAVPDGDTMPETLREYVARIAKAIGQPGRLAVSVGGSGPARTLAERARDGDIDLVVVATHGRGGAIRSGEVPLGSVPERLLSELECALMIVPSEAALDFRLPDRIGS